MGRRGPPPLPTALKKARGTLRPCRETPCPPKTTPGIPDSPPGLDSRERSEWLDLAERLIGMRVLHREESEALELLAKAKVRYRRLAARVRREGEVLTDENGRLYRNPAVVSFERAQVEFRRLLQEFGLTPAGSTRVRGEAGAAGAGPGDAAAAKRFFRLVRRTG